MEDLGLAAGPEMQGPGAANRKVAPLAARVLSGLALAFVLMSPVPALAAPYDDAKAAQARGDYATAARIYRSLADQGNVAALTQLGILYRIGRGVPRDYDEAVGLLRRAAALGSANAQYQVGDMYLRGLGVEQDLLEAARWYTRAAEQGHPLAQFGLGVLYKLGGGVRKSSTRAAKWFARSAAQGIAEAQYELGVLYRSGHGVERNYVEAYKWLSLGRASTSNSRTRTRAAEAMGDLERRMSATQLAEARERAQAWQATSERGVS